MSYKRRFKTSHEVAMQRIGFVVSTGFQVMNFAAVSVFELANLTLGEPLYDLHLLSEAGGLVRSSVGMIVETTAVDDAAFDTLIVVCDIVIAPSTPGLLAFLRRALLTSRRVGSICTGAFILAEAGLLDGRRATTHWFHARELQARFPKVRVEEDRIFIIDGPIWTSAGMTAGIDLALAMVEKDLGAEVARSVAKKLVVYHWRAGGSRSIRRCWSWNPNPIASRARWLMRRKTFRRRSPSIN
jgi:transcriptional regulator GlxA family with amidase domain